MRVLLGAIRRRSNEGRYPCSLNKECVGRQCTVGSKRMCHAYRILSASQYHCHVDSGVGHSTAFPTFSVEPNTENRPSGNDRVVCVDDKRFYRKKNCISCIEKRRELHITIIGKREVF